MPFKAGAPRRAPAKNIHRPQHSSGQASTPRPTGAFSPLPKASPVQQIQRRQRAQTVRAQRRAPARPVPAIPRLAHPSPRQVQVAKTLVRRSVQRQVSTHQSAAGQAQQHQDILRELASDPRTRGQVKTLRQYLKAESEQQAIRTLQKYLRSPQGRRAGPGALNIAGRVGQAIAPPSTRAERVAAGRSLMLPRVKARAGLAPTRLSAGIGPSLNLSALGHAVMGATSLQADSPENRFFKNAAADVKSLGTAPFVGGIEAGSAALAAVQGHPGKAVQLAKAVAGGIAQSVPARLVRGDLKGVGQQFVDHPVMSVLDLSAAEAVAGRAAGALARGVGSQASEAGARGALARAGSTVRPPLALVSDAGTQVLHERTFSKDLIRKGVQKEADKKREPLRDGNGNVVTVQDRGQTVPVLKAHDHERDYLLRRRGDFRASRANARERMTRAQAREAGRAGRVSRKRSVSNDLVDMVNEGTLRSPKTLMADLRAHRDRVQAQLKKGGYRHADEVATAEERLAFLNKALEPKNAARLEKQAPALFEAARGTAGHLNAQEAEAVRLKMLDPRAAARSKLVPAAVEHVGAEHWDVERHARVEKQARVVEEKALEHARSLPKGPARTAALKAARDARANRIAVSGREPRGVHVHEQARAAHERARRAAVKADEEVAKLERARQRLSGRQEVQRGAEAGRKMKVARESSSRAKGVLAYIDEALRDPKALERGALKEGQRAKVKAQVEVKLRAAKVRQEAARKAVRGAEAHVKANPLPPIKPGVRRKDGRFLSNEDIVKEAGVDPNLLAFLPHRSDVRGSRAHHTQFRPGSRPTLENESRTGALYQRGASGFGRERITDEAAHKAVQISKADELDSLIREDGLRHPAYAKAARGEKLNKQERQIVKRGGMWSGPEAKEAIERFRADTGQEFEAVRAFNSGLSKGARDAVRDGLQNPEGMQTLSRELLDNRVVPMDELGASRARNIVLIPKAEIDQLNRHLAPASEVKKSLQFLNGAFRMAVLPQPRWLAGNFIEPYLVRLPTVGSGLINIPGLAVDIAAARKVLGRERSAGGKQVSRAGVLEEKGTPRALAARDQMRAQQLGGLFVGGRGQTVRRTVDDALPDILKKLPAVRQTAEMATTLGDVLIKPLHGYFWSNRELIESPAQRAAFGHSLRADLRELTGSWLKSVRIGRDAAEEASRGLFNTNTQMRFMRAQHELLGKYDGFNPLMREATQTLLPFLPWSLNAARFVYWTLPAHHTILTSLLVKTGQAFDQQWQDRNKDAPPGPLRFSARTRDGGFVDVARYTPFGMSIPLATGDYASLTGQFAPQFSGVLNALEGKDPFGRDLKAKPTAKNPQGTASKVAVALNSLLEATVPYVAQARRVREGGGTAFANSTLWSPKVKPGTDHMSGVRRTFDPFRPVYLKAPGRGGAVVVSKGSAGHGDLLEQAAQREAQQGGLSQSQQDLLERAAR